MDEVSFPSHQDLDPLLDLLGIVSYLIITPPPPFCGDIAKPAGNFVSICTRDDTTF